MSETTTEATPVAEDTTTDVAGESTVDNTEQPDPADLLEGQKKVNRDLERKLKDARKAADRAADLEAELAKLQGKEAEYEQAQKARETEAAALSKANGRIVRSEIKAAAKGVLEDPADAFTFLNVDDFDVDDDGNVDESAIETALTDLINRKPYLAAQGGRRFQGSADGGARKDARPTQLTQSDLDGMSPEQIVQAKTEGRLDKLLGK